MSIPSRVSADSVLPGTVASTSCESGSGSASFPSPSCLLVEPSCAPSVPCSPRSSSASFSATASAVESPPSWSCRETSESAARASFAGAASSFAACVDAPSDVGAPSDVDARSVSDASFDALSAWPFDDDVSTITVFICNNGTRSFFGRCRSAHPVSRSSRRRHPPQALRGRPGHLKTSPHPSLRSQRRILRHPSPPASQLQDRPQSAAARRAGPA